MVQRIPFPSLAFNPPVWEVYAQLCEVELFKKRVCWQEHALVLRQLLYAKDPLRTALVVQRVVCHHLFGAARLAGRIQALADPWAAMELLARSDLPPARVTAGQAPLLARRHLGHLPRGVQRLVHRWVLARAATVRCGFFEARPGQSWGERFVGAPGQDWYQRCLTTMGKAQVRAVCRGDLASLAPGSEACAI